MPKLPDAFKHIPKEQIRTIYALIAIVAVGAGTYALANKTGNQQTDNRTPPQLQYEAETLFLAQGLFQPRKYVPRIERFYSESRLLMQLHDKQGNVYSGSVLCPNRKPCEIISITPIKNQAR